MQATTDLLTNRMTNKWTERKQAPKAVQQLKCLCGHFSLCVSVKCSRLISILALCLKLAPALSKTRAY